MIFLANVRKVFSPTFYCKLMATRLFRWSSSVLVAVRPNVRQSACARKFSSWDEPKSANEDFVIQIVSRDDNSFRWPETRLGLLEPKDHRFPLPGLVGSMNFQPQHSGLLKLKQQTPQYNADVLVAELPYERQSSVYEQYMTVNKQAATESDSHSARDVKSTPFDRLECVAHDCPVLLRKDFFDMFPNSHVHPLDSLTVITFCQKPDAVGKLTETHVADVHTDFIAAATRVCEELHTCGFWADFIDPLSGRPVLQDSVDDLHMKGMRDKPLKLLTACRPHSHRVCRVLNVRQGVSSEEYNITSQKCGKLTGRHREKIFGSQTIDCAELYLGIQTNIAFYEVDERYRRFGFEIDDSAERCRVLRHHALGSRPFVGCVFTSAPIGHPYVVDLMRTKKARPAPAVD